MEIFTLAFQRADEAGVLARLGGFTPIQRVSIFADDVVLFVKPAVADLTAVKTILNIFGEASGLRVNQ